MEKQRTPYQTDLTDAQWEQIAPLVTMGHKPAHWKRRHPLREIVNAVLYQLRTGCGWDYLPQEFPPKGTVYAYFHRWNRNGTVKRLHDALRH
jgi:transposase